MIELIAFLAAAVLLFFTLFLLLRHDPPFETPAENLAEARQALRSLEVGLLPLHLVQRIFSRADYDYVNGESSSDVRSLFIEERRKVALAWVKHVRERVVTLWHFHNRTARHSAELRLTTELNLARNFLALLAACRALEALILLAGPFATPQIVARAIRSAEIICEASKESMGLATFASTGAASKHIATL